MKRTPVAPKRAPLEHVKRLIKKLSAEERKAIVPYLATFPDTSIRSYNLKEELDVLKRHGQRTGGSDDPDAALLELVFVRNLVQVEIQGVNVLHTIFFPDNFVEAFPKVKGQVSILSEGWKESLFTAEKRAAIRAERKAQGIEETDEEFDAAITVVCNDAAQYWMTEKAKRIAEQISLHLPGMVGDMMTAAIKGQTFYDLYKAFQELSPDKTPPSVKEFKKVIQDAAWRDVKPHLPSTRNTRTNPAWRSEDTLQQYARRVNDRKLLAACIKDMYENCEGEPGWVEDLKEDTNYKLLSKEVPGGVIKWAVKRVASEDLPSREREPLSIACEMARLELELPEQSTDTLRGYYSAGGKLLRKERSQKSE